MCYFWLQIDNYKYDVSIWLCEWLEKVEFRYYHQPLIKKTCIECGDAKILIYKLSVQYNTVCFENRIPYSNQAWKEEDIPTQ